MRFEDSGQMRVCARCKRWLEGTRLGWVGGGLGVNRALQIISAQVSVTRNDNPSWPNTADLDCVNLEVHSYNCNGTYWWKVWILCDHFCSHIGVPYSINYILPIRSLGKRSKSNIVRGETDTGSCLFDNMPELFLKKLNIVTKKINYKAGTN